MKFNPMRQRIPLLKRAIPSLKKRLARITSKNGFVLKRAYDALFLLHYGNYIDRQIAFYEDYEDRQIHELLMAMRMRGRDLFIDIGANIGFYTVVVAKSGAAARVVAFEPDERNRLQLSANLLLNRLPGRVSIYPAADTSRSGVVSFRLSPDTSTGQSMIDVGEDSVSIDAVALDDVITDENKQIFIKIDIEGHELEAIRGMSRILQCNQVFLQVESFEGNAKSVIDTLTNIGFWQISEIEHDLFFTNF